jgi:hypothetical protein
VGRSVCPQRGGAVVWQHEDVDGEHALWAEQGGASSSTGSGSVMSIRLFLSFCLPFFSPFAFVAPSWREDFYRRFLCHSTTPLIDIFYILRALLSTFFILAFLKIKKKVFVYPSSSSWYRCPCSIHVMKCDSGLAYRVSLSLISEFFSNQPYDHWSRYEWENVRLKLIPVHDKAKSSKRYSA